MRTSRTRIVKQISAQDIRDLASTEIICLRVLGYHDTGISQILSRKLLRLPFFSRYSRAQEVGVQRAGLTFFETKGDKEALEQYYADASSTIKSIREACFPFLSPLDKLRLDLEEAWPRGAKIECVHEKKMLVGVVRMFEEGFELPPHQDVLARDVDEDFDALQAQLSANIYLNCPQQGGELLMWDERPDTAEFEELTHDGLHVNMQQEPAVFVKPTCGELILFNTSNLHAVRPSCDGFRVSISCFVGYRGDDEPLSYWS